MKKSLGRVWQLCKPILRFVLILWITAVVILSFVQRKLMYRPATADSLPVSEHDSVIRMFPDAVDVHFESSHGQTIGGWYLSQHIGTAGTRPVVLLFHGNAGNRAGRVAWYKLLNELGCDVLAIDYQGYGDSTGVPFQAAIEDDSVATWNYAIQELGFRPDNIFVMGISLGGAAAVYLASVQSQADAAPAGLITVSSFSSMVEVAAWLYPWFPVRAILLDRYPSADRIADVTSPFIHLHGDADRVVDQKFGRRLFEAAGNTSANGIRKQWVSLENTGHNDVLHNSRQQMFNEMSMFLRSVAATRTER